MLIEVWRASTPVHHHHHTPQWKYVCVCVVGWRSRCYTNAHVQYECRRECVSVSLTCTLTEVFISSSSFCMFVLFGDTMLHIRVKKKKGFLVCKHFYSLLLFRLAAASQAHNMYVPSDPPTYRQHSFFWWEINIWMPSAVFICYYLLSLMLIWSPTFSFNTHPQWLAVSVL